MPEYQLGLSQEQVDARVAVAVASLNMPQPATSAPPPVQANSAIGANTAYARSDHTHESRLQARRIQVTPDANGQYIYTFPIAYGAGIVPIVNVTAENVAGATARNDASIIQGTTSNTQVTIQITKLNTTIVATLLGGIINVLTAQTAPVWINIMSRAPS